MSRFAPAWVTASVVAAGLLATAACGAPYSLPARSGATPSPRSRSAELLVAVAVVDYGWHTGLVLPATALGPPLAPLRDRFPGAEYLIFGWGNRRFYETENPGSGMAVMSLFPSPSVVFVQGVGQRPVRVPLSGSDVRWLCVSPSGIRRLDSFLAGYFRKGPHGGFISAGRGLLPRSEFFASTGTYDAFHTCNTWTTEALHAAGLPIDSRGIVFATQVMAEIRSLPACGGQPR